MNDGLLPLLGRIVDSFREKTRRSYGDDDCTPIERGADDLIPINLQDAGVVLNPGFVLCVCHRSLLGRTAWCGGLCIVPRSEPSCGHTIGIDFGELSLQLLAP